MFKNKAQKENLEKDNEQKGNLRRTFRHFLDLTVNKIVCNDDYTREEKIELLQYTAEVLRRDLQAERLAKLYYEDYPEVLSNFMPRTWKSDDTEHSIYSDTDKEYVDFSKTVVVKTPTDRRKLSECIKYFEKKPFQSQENNYTAYYYKGLDLCQIISDNHSSALGIYKKEGTIQANVVDVKSMFDHVTTDGVSFFNAHTNKFLGDACDFRIPMIYQVCKVQRELGKAFC